MALELPATGVVLSIGDAGTTEAFTVIPGVVGVPTFPALVPPEIDVTALDSTGTEYILGLGDPGSFEFTLNLRRKTTGSGWNAAQQTLEGYAGDNILRGIRLEVKSGATTLRTYNVRGLVKSFQPSAPNANSQVQANVVIRLSGAVTVS
jgi:hypothetical protein